MVKLKLMKPSQIFQLTALGLALSLAGCGGGGGTDAIPIPPDGSGNNGGGNSGGNDDKPIVKGKVDLGNPPSQIQMTQGSAVRVKVRVVDSNNGVLSGRKVTFTIPNAKTTGLVNKNASTIETDENGEATITLEIPNKLTDEQKENLKNKGVTIKVATDSDSKSFTIKGSEAPVTVDSEYIVHVVNSVSTMNTGRDKTNLVFRVLDEKGGIKTGVPVSFELQPDPEAISDYGVSFGTASTIETDDKGQVSVDLVQSKTGIDAQLDHSVTVIAKINDIQEQSLIVDVSGTKAQTVSTVLGSSTNAKNDLVSIDGDLVDGSGDSIIKAPVSLYNGDNEVATGTTDSKGEFIFKDISLAKLATTKKDGKEVYVFDMVVKGKKIEQRLANVAAVTKVTSETIEIDECVDPIIGKTCAVTVKVPNKYNGKTVRLITTKGQFSNSSNTSEAKVNGGKATFKISSNSPGAATLTAEIGKDVSYSKPMRFLSIDPATLIVQATKVELPTNNTTTVKARVLDKNDAPVQNAWVQFTVVKDSSGGNLEKGLVKTDESGVATTIYSSGGNPTQSGGVEIRAKVHSVELNSGKRLTDKVDDVDPKTVKLTVQTAASTITTGLANKLSISGGNDVYYFRQGSIAVTNNGGQPAANQVVTLKLLPHKYFKGGWIYDYRKVTVNGKDYLTNEKEWHIPEPYTIKYAIMNPDYVCKNEDVNFNSILDKGEDYNKDGYLNPGFRATVLVNGQVVSGNNGTYTLNTDSKGRVDFQIRYFKQYAQWMTMNMIVSTSVDGTEASQERIIKFPVLADDVNDDDRPNVTSPFGTNKCDTAG